MPKSDKETEGSAGQTFGSLPDAINNNEGTNTDRKQK